MTSGTIRQIRPSLRRVPVSSPMISVVMPVRNEAAHIHETLTQLVKQDYPANAFEVLVVDGESTDNTRSLVESIARRHPQVKLLHNPRRWSSSARNIGIRAAQGDLVLIVDGHCEIPDEYLLRAVADAFERSEADCLGRPQPLDVRKASPLQRAIAAARSSWLGHHPASFIYTEREQFVPAHSVAVAYRREVFDQVGLFDESFDACEDVELNHRVDKAGMRCLFTPEIAVRYEPRSSLRGLFRQLVRYGRGRIRLLRKHHDTLSWPALVPAFFLLGLVAGLPLSFLAAPLAWIYFSVLGLYAFFVLGVSLGQAAYKQDWLIIPWLPPIFVTIHLATGWGLIREALLPGRNKFAKAGTSAADAPAARQPSEPEQPQDDAATSSAAASTAAKSAVSSTSRSPTSSTAE